jgi:hypothetical protein
MINAAARAGASAAYGGQTALRAERLKEKRKPGKDRTIDE